MEQPITFTNRRGRRLFGMCYLPEPQVSRNVGILICVNAVKYRLGTFRLHVLLARKLCELGYSVFCFDPEGIGDSEGEFESKLLTEHYHDIQHGKYSSDLADAVKYFTSEHPVGSLLLFGLCGGAISVLIEAATDSRVDGLILLNLPVLVEDLKRKGVENHAAKITSVEKAGNVLAAKGRRLLELSFWWRLVKLQVDLREEGRLVRRSLSVLADKLWRASRAATTQQSGISLSTPVSNNPLYNMNFQSSFAAVMAMRKQVLFVFAELDPWTLIFKSEFQDAVLGPGNGYESYCTLRMINAANHIFSATESQRQLQEAIVDWLEDRFARLRSAA